MSKKTFRKMCVLAGMMALSVCTPALVDDTKIQISRALNSPTLAIKYSGANVTLVELRINGDSVGTRNVSSAKSSGETTFTIDLSTLKDGDNDVEVRLFDKGGKLVGTEKTVITTDSDTKGPVFLASPKIGATVQGPVTIDVGFGRQFSKPYVNFFVDNQFKAITNYPPYTFTWDSQSVPNGWHEIEAWLIDDTSTTYKTRKVKVFVNNPGGRTNRPGVEPRKEPAPESEAMLANPVKAGVVGSPLDAKQIGSAVAVAGDGTIQAAMPGVTGIMMANSLRATLVSGMAGLKAPDVLPSVAAGAKSMTPTGKRVVQEKKPKTQPQAKIDTTAQIKVSPNPDVKLTLPGVAPKATPAKATVKPPVQNKVNTKTQPKTVADTKPKQQTAKVTTKPQQQQKTVQPTIGQTLALKIEPMPKALKANLKPKTTLTLSYGSKIKAKSFKIFYGGEAVEFDVAPKTIGGVPVAPFRHLLEKAGGKVNWQDSTKSVKAYADGRDIYIVVGNSIAKIDGASVDMELAPFLEKGRIIVPVSFMRDVLSVDVEYDKATNHVLITKSKG